MFQTKLIHAKCFWWNCKMSWRIQPCHFATPHWNWGYANEILFFCPIFLLVSYSDWIITVFQLFVNGGQEELELITPNPTSHQKISGNKKVQRKATVVRTCFHRLPCFAPSEHSSSKTDLGGVGRGGGGGGWKRVRRKIFKIRKRATFLRS